MNFTRPFLSQISQTYVIVVHELLIKLACHFFFSVLTVLFRKGTYADATKLIELGCVNIHQFVFSISRETFDFFIWNLAVYVRFLCLACCFLIFFSLFSGRVNNVDNSIQVIMNLASFFCYPGMSYARHLYKASYATEVDLCKSFKQIMNQPEGNSSPI